PGGDLPHPLARRPAIGRRTPISHRDPGAAPRADRPRPGLPVPRLRTTGGVVYDPPHPPLETWRGYPPAQPGAAVLCPPPLLHPPDRLGSVRVPGRAVALHPSHTGP